MSLRNVPRHEQSDSDFCSSDDEDESGFHVEEFTSVSQALDRAEQVITYLNKENMMPINPSAVFDLDETILKYIGPDEDNDFPRKFPGMGGFIEWLRNHNIQMCYITARREKGYRDTLKTLKKVDIWRNSDELLMKPNDAPSNSSSIVKDQQRRDWTRAGYSIVINVGDQLSDMIPKREWKVFLSGAMRLPSRSSLKKEIKKACKEYDTVTDILEEAMANLTKTLVFWELEDDVLLSIKMRNQEFFTR